VDADVIIVSVANQRVVVAFSLILIIIGLLLLH